MTLKRFKKLNKEVKKMKLRELGLSQALAWVKSIKRDFTPRKEIKDGR